MAICIGCNHEIDYRKHSSTVSTVDGRWHNFCYAKKHDPERYREKCECCGEPYCNDHQSYSFPGWCFGCSFFKKCADNEQYPHFIHNGWCYMLCTGEPENKHLQSYQLMKLKLKSGDTISVNGHLHFKGEIHSMEQRYLFNDSQIIEEIEYNKD